MLPPESRYPFAPDLPICRLLNGLWQVYGGHGQIDPANAIADMLHYHDAGFTTWDLADHNGRFPLFVNSGRRRGDHRRAVGVAEHRAENARVFSFQLDAADWKRLDAVHGHSRDLFALIGDCGDEYRR